MSKFPLLSRPQQRKTMTPAALAANKANAQKAGRPKGKISLSDISFRDRCRVRDEEHIAILEHIARYSENEGFRLAGICSIEGAVAPGRQSRAPVPVVPSHFRWYCRPPCVTTMTSVEHAEA